MDIKYGPYQVHFLFSAERARTGMRTTLPVAGIEVTVATVAQAFVDELGYWRDGDDYIQTARVLRNAVQAGRVDGDQLLRALGPDPSIAVARRVGFLLDLVDSKPNPKLLSIARANRVPTSPDEAVIDKTWHVGLPTTRRKIAQAIQ